MPHENSSASKNLLDAFERMSLDRDVQSALQKAGVNLASLSVDLCRVLSSHETKSVNQEKQTSSGGKLLFENAAMIELEVDDRKTIIPLGQHWKVYKGEHFCSLEPILNAKTGELILLIDEGRHWLKIRQLDESKCAVVDGLEYFFKWTRAF